jgi:hypothetical protein
MADTVSDPNHYPVYPEDPGYYKEAGQPFSNH